MDCYGLRYTKKAECAGCKLSIYCKDAVYKPLNHAEFNDCMSAAAVNYTPIKEEIEEKKENIIADTIRELLLHIADSDNKKDSILGVLEIIATISSLSQSGKNDRAIGVIVSKLLYPAKSFEQIAKEHNCTKQNIGYYIKKVKTGYPQLSKSLCIETRFNRWQERKKQANKLKQKKRRGYISYDLQPFLPFSEVLQA